MFDEDSLILNFIFGEITARFPKTGSWPLIIIVFLNSDFADSIGFGRGRFVIFVGFVLGACDFGSLKLVLSVGMVSPMLCCWLFFRIGSCNFSFLGDSDDQF